MSKQSSDDNMQNRINNMFTNQEPPSYASAREVDAMKARINELEIELARHNEIKQVTEDRKEKANLFAFINLLIKKGFANFFSSEKSTATHSEAQSNTALRILVILIISILVSLPFYIYSAIKTNSWQIYVITAGLIISGVIVVYCISLIRAKHIEQAMEVIIATACLFIPLIVALVSGVGIVLATTLFLITFTVVGQTLSGGRANRFLFLGFAFSILTLFIDFSASWQRLSVPALQSTIPIIALGLVGLLMIFMARQFRDYKIRGKLVVTFVVITLISVGALGFVANQITTTQFDRELGSNFHELASRMAREVGDAIVKSKIALDGLVLNKFVQDTVVEANTNGSADTATLLTLDQQWTNAQNSSPLIRQVLNNELSVELKEFRTRLPQYAEVFVTDRYGAVIASTDRTSDYYQADEEWWRTAWNNGKGAIYISQPVYDDSTKIYAIDIALPIPSHNGKDIVGVLRATVDINELTSLLTASQLGQTGQAVLALPNNRYLSNQTGVNFSTFSLVTSKGIASINGPYGQVNYEGVPSLVSIVPVTSVTGQDKEAIEQLRWSVVVHQDIPEAHQPITNTTQGLLITAIGVLIATGLLAIFVGGQFARPIENLTAVAEQAANGNLSIKATEQTQDEIGVLANTFNRMTSQLRETLLGLEERVSDRTHDLELASEVGQAITEKVSNISALLFEAAELIRSRFNLYYTQIYLVDAAGRNLYLRAGTGEVGQQLLRRSHHLAISPTSLNGRAVLEKHPVLVGDTQANPNFLPNPLLPLTRSELAVPLISGGTVVGVLDMQSEKPDTFSNANIPAFQVLAGQLAIAIQNSALFADADAARLELEEQARRLTKTGWQDYLNGLTHAEKIGYVYDQVEILPLTESQAGDHENSLAHPIQVTGANIGEVRLSDKKERVWTDTDKEIVKNTITQLGQHIENLRLLSRAEQYRLEAEQAARRLTREGWNEYISSRNNLINGYIYQENKVQPLIQAEDEKDNDIQTYPIYVHDEHVGDFAIDNNNLISQEVEDIIASVSQQLSSHIENLRLLDETQSQRSQLSDALTTAKLGNWEFDYGRGVFIFNDNFYQIFHTTAEQEGGYEMSAEQYSSRFVHPEDGALVGEEIGKAIASPLRVYDAQVEHRFLYVDGGVGHMAVSIRIEKDENGQIVRWTGANQDITERKISELALRESEARLAEAAAIAKLGYWEFDVRTETYTFTDQFYALLGTTAEKEGGYQMSAKDYIQKYMHPDDRYMVNNEIQKSTNSTEDELFGQFENRFIRADGSEGYVTGRSRVIKDAQGQVIKTIGFNQDITERKLAEEELRINEARLAEALEIARLANWEYDVEKDIFTFNDNFYSIFRTTVEEVGSYQISSAQYAGRFVHPDDLPIVGIEIEKALTSKERFYSASLEHRIRYSDGSVGYISVNINVERDENGKITRYYGANQDITERKQAEEIVAKRAEQLTVLNRVMAVANSSTDLQLILQTATEEFRMLMQAFSAGVLMLDEQGESLTLVTESYADPNMPRLAGRVMPVASNPATNKSIKSGDTVLVPNAQTDPILAPIHAIMKQRNIQSVLVTPLISRNKVIGVFSVDTNQPDRHFDENDIALIETLSKQLASAIESIQLFDETKRRASDLSTVATVSTATSTILDPDQLLQTVVDITKERFNLYHAHIYLTDNSWDTLLLAAGAGNIGKQMMETGHAIPIDAEKSLVARAARERRAIVINNVQEEEGYLPNELLPNTRAEITVPMIVGDAVLGVFDVQSDKPEGFSNEDADIYTTLATQVAVALQNARLYVEQAATVTQLRELDRLKSSFLANMSHELRTPLNSILGFTDVMLEELDGPLTPNMGTDLKLIQKNGKHLLHLINDVLDMAKIESGKMNLLIEKFNLHEIIEEVISITSPLANEKNLVLYTEPDSNHDVDISADHTRLRQVMINLVNNAIKFTEKGNVSIRAEKEENNVLISVHDTGIGIPISHLEDVFLEFTQVDTSTTRKAGGTGLGLPISRRLIEMHGGRLWAESTGVNGEGSTFYIFLPLEAKVAENVESEPHIRK